MGLLTRPQKSLALDWGSSSLKIVELEQNREQVKLNNFIIKEIDAIQLENDFNSNKLVQLLQDIFKQEKFNTTDLNFIISGSNVITKILTLPTVAKEKLRKLIFWEAESIFAKPPSELIFDYQILASKANKIKIILAVVAKDSLIKQVELLEQAGIKVSQIQAAPLLLNNILREELTREKLAIIDIGAVKTEITIFNQGQYDFRRVFSSGSNKFTAEIAKKNSLSYREAEKLKRSTVFELDLIENNLEKLLKKINLSFHYWQQQGQQLERLLLTGGGAKLKGLVQVLEEEFQIEVELLTGLSQFDFAVTDCSYHLLKEQLPWLAISIAAAVSSFKKRR
ncbi:MAG: pilus assembly protein PilM [Bacillota bacterium]